MRFGEPGAKLCARVAGKPLVQHAVDAMCSSAATTCDLLLGAGAQRVLAAVDMRRAAARINDDWAGGLSSTIRLAVASHADADACVLMLGDAPYVRAADIDALIAAWRAAPSSIVALRSGGVWGVPVIFPRALFGALGHLTGDAGAKMLAARERRRLRFVDAQDRRAFADVDRSSDIKRRSAPRSRGTRRSRARR
jgi:molybdenum cofactor cytidylyltransferase